MTKPLRVHVVWGNTKIGQTGNVSLPPVVCCKPGVPCATGGCYAKRSYCLWGARPAWDENLALLQEDREEYFTQIGEAIARKAFPFFRWHVGGDIVDQDYLDQMCHVAEAFPDTHFMAYTKQYDLRFTLPENLVVIASMWPGYGDPDRITLPRFWMQDGTEYRVPSSAFTCPGSCEECRVCWWLGRSTGYQDVMIYKHPWPVVMKEQTSLFMDEPPPPHEQTSSHDRVRYYSRKYQKQRKEMR